MGVPPDLRPRLVTPDSWIMGDSFPAGDENSARVLLRTLWTAVAGDVPIGFPRASFRVVLVSSQRANIHVRVEDDGTFSVILTDALLHAVTTYTRAWVAFHEPAALPALDDIARRTAARDSVLAFAWWYRHTGRARPAALTVTEDAAAMAAAHAAVGMTFLLAHEIAHVLRGHVGSLAAGSACLDIETTHRQEHDADLLATSWLLASPPAITRGGQSVRILFELLELLAVGTPGDEVTHPVVMRRLLDILATLDRDEHTTVLAALQRGRQDFWLLADN